jgi:hypothetical protein
MTINNKIINTIERYSFERTFPVDLKRFLKDKYSEEPWPYEHSEQGLYENIRRDAADYFAGRLDVAIKTPIEKLEIENQYLRELYGDAMCEIREMRGFIDRVCALLLEHGFGCYQQRPEGFKGLPEHDGTELPFN